jgi:hypothetical protein
MSIAAYHPDGQPEYLTAADLAAHGITPADVRRRCPLAVWYGPASAPYWHRHDLAPLLAEEAQP